MAGKDRDVLVKTDTPRSTGPRSVTLPTGPLGEPTDPDGVSVLERQLAEVEDSLRYMGAVHPQRDAYVRRAQQLRALLEQARPGSLTPR